MLKFFERTKVLFLVFLGGLAKYKTRRLVQKFAPAQTPLKNKDVWIRWNLWWWIMKLPEKGTTSAWNFGACIPTFFFRELHLVRNQSWSKIKTFLGLQGTIVCNFRLRLVSGARRLCVDNRLSKMLAFDCSWLALIFFKFCRRKQNVLKAHLAVSLTIQGPKLVNVEGDVWWRPTLRSFG